MTDAAEIVTAWENLSPEQRIADRMAAIQFAADQVRGIIATADTTEAASLAAFDNAARKVQELVGPALAYLRTFTATSIERDPELEDVLLQLDVELSLAKRRRGMLSDDTWNQLDIIAAPYALAFYYEIRRLDHLGLVAKGGLIDRHR